MASESSPQFRSIKAHVSEPSHRLFRSISPEETQFRSIKAHVSEPSHRLPEEIIEEILSRLPVKSLLRFRCVSKPWRDLIGSKSFVKKHLANSTENPNFANHKIILDSMIPWRRLKQCSLTSMLNDPFTVQFKSFSLKNIRRDWIRIVGCCDGLVCLLLNRKHFMLWNPSTRKTKKLPHIDGRIIERGYISSYGFGYDDLSGDYMVFGIAAIFGSGVRYETICKVYSLETNSWKIVEVENVSRFTRWGKFASGKIHWDKRGGIITYFDLRSKVFDVIKPPITNGVFCRSVGVFGGRACLVCDDRVGNFDIWVIKEYGVNASWERAVKIPYLRTTLVPRGVSFSSEEASFLSILGTCPNGEILLTTRSSFEIFHPESSGFRRCRVRGPFSFRADICVESLVQCTPYIERDA